jgi:hypothetical protein
MRNNLDILMLYIFISYASEDTQFAERVHDLLGMYWSDKVNCFLAPRSIPAGSNWENKILENIAEADLLFVLWSRSSRCSYGQIVEIGAAWALEKEILVFSIDETELPFILRDTQAITNRDFLTTFDAYIS